jgi:hypothetical protein
VKDAREKIINGEEDYRTLITDHVGEIKATILERNGQVWMVKECPKHGKFEDMMAKDVKFLEWIEKNFPGRDIRAHNDERLHNHGTSTIKHGRGSVLTVDLTNRCNMMCDPCFMDANQVGYVHELSWEEIQEIMKNALESNLGGKCPSIFRRRTDHVAYFIGRSVCSRVGIQQCSGCHQWY